jgi:hypothetical protein
MLFDLCLWNVRELIDLSKKVQPIEWSVLLVSPSSKTPWNIPRWQTTTFIKLNEFVNV